MLRWVVNSESLMGAQGTVARSRNEGAIFEWLKFSFLPNVHASISDKKDNEAKTMILNWDYHLYFLICIFQILFLSSISIYVEWILISYGRQWGSIWILLGNPHLRL